MGSGSDECVRLLEQIGREPPEPEARAGLDSGQDPRDLVEPHVATTRPRQSTIPDTPVIAARTRSRPFSTDRNIAP